MTHTFETSTVLPKFKLDPQMNDKEEYCRRWITREFDRLSFLRDDERNKSSVWSVGPPIYETRIFEPENPDWSSVPNNQIESIYRLIYLIAVKGR